MVHVYAADLEALFEQQQPPHLTALPTCREAIITRTATTAL